MDRITETKVKLAKTSFVLELDYDAPETNTLKFPEADFVKEVPPKMRKLNSYKGKSESTNLPSDVAEVGFALTYGADSQESNLSSILLVYLPHSPPYVCYNKTKPGFLVQFLQSTTEKNVSSFKFYVYIILFTDMKQ